MIIEILPEDFDLSNAEYDTQYIHPSDCPLARALKRYGFSNVTVIPGDVKVNRTMYSVDWWGLDCRQAFKRFKGGDTTPVVLDIQGLEFKFKKRTLCATT